MNNLLYQIHRPGASAFTHSGKFHADDVFSAALLLYLNPEIMTKCSVRNTVFADPAVFLVMIVLSSSDVKYNPVKVFRYTIAAFDHNFRVQKCYT